MRQLPSIETVKRSQEPHAQLSMEAQHLPAAHAEVRVNQIRFPPPRRRTRHHGPAPPQPEGERIDEPRDA